MKKIFFTALLLSQTLLAGAGIEISRDLSATSKGNNLSLDFTLDSFEDTETGSFGLSNRLAYDFSDSVATVNLNSALSDFEIISITHRLGYDVTINEDLTFAFKIGRTTFNSDEARQDVFSGGLYYQLWGFQIGYVASNTDTYQVRPVVILSTDYTDSIRYNRKSGSYYLSYNWTKNFSTSVNYTQYQYDKNLDNSYALLSTQPFLNRGGSAVANDVGSQLKNSLDLNLTYLLTPRLLLNFGIGTAQEYLSPSAKSNDASLGLDYEITIYDFNYRVFGILNVSKAEGVEGTSNSGQVGIGFSF